MVPVEPISLSIGVTALFTTCIECFEYFKAATTLQQDLNILLLKLELEQERLLVWGEIVGIGNEEWDQEPAPEGTSNRHNLVQKCLSTIKSLLEDADTLKSKYDPRSTAAAVNAPSHQTLSSNALKRFRVRLGRSSKGLGVLQKTVWAIHDAAKFEKLVANLRDLIGGLVREAPEKLAIDDQVQRDIASMTDDIASLRLVSEACEDAYPVWSEMARSAIAASEIATIDERHAENNPERLDNGTNASQDVTRPDPLVTWFGDDKFYLEIKTKLFFILTEQCRNEGTTSPCDQIELGSKSFSMSNSFIPLGSSRLGSDPGHWIAKDIEPSEFTGMDLEQAAKEIQVLRAHAIEHNEEASLYNPFMVNLYIYCAPCACQVATALQISQSMNNFPHLNVCIRVDHNQVSSCSISASRIEGIVSLIGYVKSRERYITAPDTVPGTYLKAIDRQWLEKNVYEYEEEVQMRTSSPANRLARIVRSHRDEELCAAIIILGEADYNIPLLSAPPLPPFRPGATPQETQLYGACNSLDKIWLWRRYFLGTYTKKEPLTKKRPLATERAEKNEVEPSSKRSMNSNSGQEGSNQ